MTLTVPAINDAAAALLPDGQSYIGYAPGAGGAEKRWPLDHYVTLASMQTQTPVFFLGPQEQEARAVIEAALPNALFPECAADPALRGPRLVIALARRLSAAVANDAGPGHMLAAGGAPLLSLQKDERKAIKFKPAATRLEVLVAERYGDGMAALPVRTAHEALGRLLRGND